MFCKNCNSQIPDEAAFCTNCGTLVEDDFGDTGLLNEDDLEATGLLTENENVQENYTYEQTVDAASQQNSNVNPAFVNPNFYQNQVQQSVAGNESQSNPFQQTAIADNTNAYSQNCQYTFAEQPTLKNCYKKFWQNYTNFSGRARRSEYWFVVLANFLIAFVNIIPYVGQVLYSLYALAVLVPTLALIVRRLHDLGKEWYYIFFLFIPIAGQIIMLVWLCTDSQVGANQFGANPKGIN